MNRTYEAAYPIATALFAEYEETDGAGYITCQELAGILNRFGYEKQSGGEYTETHGRALGQMASAVRQACACLIVGLIALVMAAPAIAQQRRALQLGVAFSRDTSWPATCGDCVRVYDVKTGKLLRAIDGRLTRTVAFSPAAADLFAEGDDDGILRVWRVGKKEFARQFRGHDGTIASVAFDKSGQYVASGSVRYVKGKRNLGQFRLWDIKSGKAVQSIDARGAGIQGVSFSGDGELVAFCRNLLDKACQVDVYRIAPWKLVTSIKLAAGEKLETTQFGKAVPFGIATRFEPDHKRLLVAGGICVRVDPRPYRYACRPTGLLWRCDLAKPASARRLVEPSRGYYRSLGLAPDGKRFATANGVRIKADRPRIQMRDVTNGKLLWSVESEVVLFGVTMSPDGKLVAATQRDGVVLLNAKTGQSVRLIMAKN